MDEPLSNLEAKLRAEMRTELKRLHQSTDSTFVYVTHDQLEAMTLATRICLINKGLMQQYEPPLKVYAEPANLFVADFIGNPTMNFINAKVTGVTGKKVDIEFAKVKASFDAKNAIEVKKGQQVVIGVRPEYLTINEKGKIKGEVYGTLPAGMETTVKIELGDMLLSSVVFGQIDYKMYSKINFNIDGDGIILYDAETTNKLGVGKVTIK